MSEQDQKRYAYHNGPQPNPAYRYSKASPGYYPPYQTREEPMQQQQMPQYQQPMPPPYQQQMPSYQQYQQPIPQYQQQPMPPYQQQPPQYQPQQPQYQQQIPQYQQPMPPPYMPQQNQTQQNTLPMEQSYIENILRMNYGKEATVYMTFEYNEEWNARVFRGTIEAAGRDHIILKETNSDKRYLLLMVYLDYVTFHGVLNYSYPYGRQSSRASQQTS